jgi:hypothetical protein
MQRCQRTVFQGLGSLHSTHQYQRGILAQHRLGRKQSFTVFPTNSASQLCDFRGWGQVQLDQAEMLVFAMQTQARRSERSIIVELSG